MLKPKTRWNVRETSQQKVQQLVNELNIPPLVAVLLINRGIDDTSSARAFLFDGEEFHDPFLLKDMDIVVERIKKAITLNEPILIYGDYDADGVTSTAVLMIALKQLGANVQYYIPNRFSEGYGPNERAFLKAAESRIRLIITVDTGIAAIHEAKVAKELGIDLIVTDHHEPGPELPDTYATIHPKIPGSKYPFHELAGVGVAFKLAHALYGKLPEHLLDLVAIGTIADLVSLTGENRLIAKRGIVKLRETNRVGLIEMFHKARINQVEIDEETVGFVIAPRINAVGRLDQADKAVELLLTLHSDEGEQFANEIEEMNRERQLLVNQMTEEAIKVALLQLEQTDDKVLIIAQEDWNSGVIGIVASRLVDHFYRPVIVLSIDSETGLAKGSARSIAGFDLFRNLSLCRDLLPHFGGHQMAAGMTLRREDIDALRIRINELARNQLTEEDFTPITELDAVVNLEDIDLSTIEEINQLAPYGTDNPKPKILIENLHYETKRKIGADKNHLKILLKQASATLDGIGFRMGHLDDAISPYAEMSVVGELSINEWNNRRKPQIILRDLAINTWQLFDLRGSTNYDYLSEVVPRNNRKWIVFHENTIEKLNLPLEDNIRVVRSPQEALNVEIAGHTVLVDLPPTKDLMVSLIHGKQLENVYAYFYKEESDFFSTMPTREHFKWYYAFLVKKGPFDLKHFGDQLAKYRGWTKETIDFMSQVFLELQFVKISNGIIRLANNMVKRDLSESPTYERKQTQFALEKEFLYSSYQELKSWFDAHCQGPAENEEALKAWT